MNEQELREAIKIAVEEAWEEANITKGGTWGQFKDSCAERISFFVQQHCWPKGEQELPKPDSIEFTIPSDTLMVSRTGLSVMENLLPTYLQAQQDMLRAGFKPCGEWEMRDGV